MAETPHTQNTAIVDKSVGRLLPVLRLSTIAAAITVIFLLYAFFSGLTLQFYASFLFLFYSWTKRMWIAVMMLGVFQTLLMIPFRIVNLFKSANIEEFKHTLEEISIEEEQQYFLKRRLGKGGRIALYYFVNFFIAVVSYTSIGRLFLTDFYSIPLNPDLLYSFVSYPAYPILDRMFKLPYTWFTQIKDFGSSTVLWTWAILISIQLIIFVGLYFLKKNKKFSAEKSKKIRNYTTGNLILFLIVSWYLIRHFPIAWEFRIFTGDVSIPNKTLNTVTAIATFITLLWTSMPKIRQKIMLAKKAGFTPKVITRTEKTLLQENFKVASFVGLGAYFITNLIPSAFELSIFTLEVISLAAPLTLDKLILKGAAMRSTTPDKTPGKDVESATSKEDKPSGEEA